MARTTDEEARTDTTSTSRALIQIGFVVACVAIWSLNFYRFGYNRGQQYGYSKGLSDCFTEEVHKRVPAPEAWYRDSARLKVIAI